MRRNAGFWGQTKENRGRKTGVRVDFPLPAVNTLPCHRVRPPPRKQTIQEGDRVSARGAAGAGADREVEKNGGLGPWAPPSDLYRYRYTNCRESGSCGRVQEVNLQDSWFQEIQNLVRKAGKSTLTPLNPAPAPSPRTRCTPPPRSSAAGPPPPAAARRSAPRTASTLPAQAPRETSAPPALHTAPERTRWG